MESQSKLHPPLSQDHLPSGDGACCKHAPALARHLPCLHHSLRVVLWVPILTGGNGVCQRRGLRQSRSSKAWHARSTGCGGSPSGAGEEGSTPQLRLPRTRPIGSAQNMWRSVCVRRGTGVYSAPPPAATGSAAGLCRKHAKAAVVTGVVQCWVLTGYALRLPTCCQSAKRLLPRIGGLEPRLPGVCCTPWDWRTLQ